MNVNASKAKICFCIFFMCINYGISSKISKAVLPLRNELTCAAFGGSEIQNEIVAQTGLVDPFFFSNALA